MSKEFYGFEKLSLVDLQDFLACTLFTGGCNFRCPFCHNSALVIDYDKYQTFDFDEIMEYLRLRKNMLDAVVISGGEPTLLDELEDKIRQIKELGYFIKFDTNGSNLKVVKNLVDKKLIDYVAMDIKNCKDRYNETIGLDNYSFDKIQESIDYLKANNVDYEFRTTLVSELHSLDDIKKMGELVKGAKKLYLQKFVDHESCIKDGFHEVPKEVALEYKKVLEKYVDKVYLRGY